VKAPGPMEYWLTKTMRRHHPRQPMANTIGMESVDKSLAVVPAHGGKVALPKAISSGSCSRIPARAFRRAR
jgi:hypothetical protein